MDTTKTPETMSAAFELWQKMNAAVPALDGSASTQMCEKICALEAEMLALPVASIEDIWALVAAVLDPPEAGDITFEAILARRARLESGLPVA